MKQHPKITPKETVQRHLGEFTRSGTRSDRGRAVLGFHRCCGDPGQLTDGGDARPRVCVRLAMETVRRMNRHVDPVRTRVLPHPDAFVAPLKTLDRRHARTTDG